MTYFNPRSPCGERRVRMRTAVQKRPISIHAPRVGSDNISEVTNVSQAISIHAPRVGSDRKSPRIKYIITISIHAPRVGSDVDAAIAATFRFLFQSTLPVWGATAKMHRFFFCIFGKNGIFCDILQIGRHLQGIGRKRRGDFLSRSVRTSRGKYGYLAFAFRESGGLRENRRFYSQSVLFSFRIDCQGSRIEGCPFRGP